MFKKIIRGVKVFLGFEDSCEHLKDVYCVGRIAFVKCLKCGAESIPWEVKQEVADAWTASHKERLEALYEFDRARK